MYLLHLQKVIIIILNAIYASIVLAIIYGNYVPSQFETDVEIQLETELVQNGCRRVLRRPETAVQQQRRSSRAKGVVDVQVTGKRYV